MGRPGDPATRRPGDPATRRPGDPATRRPGDPATQLNYTLGTLGGACQPPSRHDPGSRSHTPHRGGDIRPNPVQPSRHDHLPCLRRRVRRTRTSARNPRASLPHLYRNCAPGERPRATPCAPHRVRPVRVPSTARCAARRRWRGLCRRDSGGRLRAAEQLEAPGTVPTGGTSGRCAGNDAKRRPCGRLRESGPSPACAWSAPPRPRRWRGEGGPLRRLAAGAMRLARLSADAGSGAARRGCRLSLPRPALRVRISANRVVTGAKIGLRASGCKDRANRKSREALVTGWYGAATTELPPAAWSAEADVGAERRNQVPLSRSIAMSRGQTPRHRHDGPLLTGGGLAQPKRRGGCRVDSCGHAATGEPPGIDEASEPRRVALQAGPGTLSGRADESQRWQARRAETVLAATVGRPARRSRRLGRQRKASQGTLAALLRLRPSRTARDGSPIST